jgi:hypothetical protein
MIGIMTKEQLAQVEDMLTNQYPADSWTNHYSLNTSFKT